VTTKKEEHPFPRTSDIKEGDSMEVGVYKLCMTIFVGH
jgi:hypothetical protein